MATKTLKEIMYEYAEQRGGGLPLTAQEICNAVVMWAQEYVRNESSISVEDLSKLLEGSDTVVVDINEAGDKIEIHLDGEVVAKLDRAILTPISPPTEISVPMLTPTNEIVYEPATSFSDVKFYKHKIVYGTAGQFFTLISRKTDTILTLENLKTAYGNLEILMAYYGGVNAFLDGVHNTFYFFSNGLQQTSVLPTNFMRDEVSEY